MGEALRRYQRRRKAIETLANVIKNSDHVIVIHYSCESFYDRPEGTSFRITSIATANFENSQTNSFSIHQVAERAGVHPYEIQHHYDELEHQMLCEFYEYVKTHIGYKWLHWNMKNIHFGFQAIAHRFQVLSGQPVEVNEANLFDLSKMLIEIYGPGYIGHRRLEKITEKNRISMKDFLTGEQEAIAFEKGEYVKLHFSTLRKVDILTSLARRADEKTLVTNSSWKELYGYYPKAFFDWLQDSAWFQVGEAILAIIGFIASIIQLIEFVK